MSNVFLISDQHFGHANILTFFVEGVRLRQEFSCVQDMDVYMVDRHNSVVKKEDRVYHLGDFCFSNRHLEVLSHLNGRHVLIKGNHDKLKLSQYAQYFDDIRGTHQFDGFILSHIPIHPASLTRWPVNIHGHLHSYNVTKEDGSIDNRYFSVCVEQPHIKYTPISLEEIKTQIRSRENDI